MKENVIAFEKILVKDEQLQERLKAAINGYEGDKTDERAFFDAVLAPLAAEAGLPFTFDEQVELAEEGVEIDDAELDAVAGGWGFCIVLGFSTAPEAGCGRNEGHACAYFPGVGIPDCTK